MNKLLVICMLSICASGFHPNGEAAEPDTGKNGARGVHQEASVDVGPILDKLDVDGDGNVSKGEAGQLQGLSEAFEDIDKSKDGELNAAELSKFLAPTSMQ
jgi:EF hand